MAESSPLWFVGPPLEYAAQQIFLAALRSAGIIDYHLTSHVEEAVARKPLMTVALGNTHAAALIPQWPTDGIQALRGYLWDTPTGRVMATIAPQDCITAWTPWRALLDFDMRRVATEVKLGAPPLDVPEVEVVTTKAQLDELWLAINAARNNIMYRDSFLLSVDIENDNELNLSCCGFAPTPKKAWVIPAVPGWQKEAIRELVENDIPKVFQNGQYDRLFMKLRCGWYVRGHAFDTQLAWHALNPELAGKKTAVGEKKARSRRTAKSLQFLASIYLRVPHWKDYDFLSEVEKYRLNGLDVCHTLAIAQKERVQLKAANLLHIHDFERDLLDPCLAMTERGMPVDNARRLQMIADLEAGTAPLARELEEYVVKEVLPATRERLNGKAHLFTKRIVCRCCKGGKAKAQACWACAGFEKKPTRKMLAEKFGANILKEKGEVLTACAQCDGVGKWDHDVFNPGSPPQVSIVLYDLLRLPIRTKDGAPSADEKALKSLLAVGTPATQTFIKKLLRLTKMETIAAVLRRIEPDAGGRVHAIYNPAGTESGRFSIAETFLIEASTNLGNMPKKEATEALFDVRSVFRPPAGYAIVEADLEGAEQWITTACAQDVEFLRLLQSGAKVHRWTAARAKYNGDESKVTDQDYALYKTARHALNYGMQVRTFVENVNHVADRTGVAITLKQGQEVYDGYHALHPNLQKVFWLNVQTAIQSSGMMSTCFGRRRIFYGRNKHEWLGEAHREAIAHEPQSTIADLLNRGLLRWWRQHDGKIGNLLAQVYDSVYILCRESQATLCATLVKRCLTEEIVVHGIKLTVPVDVKILKTLAAVKPKVAA